MTSSLSLGLLLAVFIALQNLPEGFNSFNELVRSNEMSRGPVLGVLGLLALAGPLCGALGLWLLSDQPAITGGVMLFAAGGILYLTFQDIAPQAHLERHWGPPLGAVLGFGLGMVGHMLIS